jgi:hypothetical protein
MTWSRATCLADPSVGNAALSWTCSPYEVFEMDAASFGNTPLAPDGEHFIIIEGDP